jgi:hypothetical protein
LCLEPHAKGKSTRLRLSTMTEVAAVGLSVRASAQFESTPRELSLGEWKSAINEAPIYNTTSSNPMMSKSEVIVNGPVFNMAGQDPYDNLEEDIELKSTEGLTALSQTATNDYFNEKLEEVLISNEDIDIPRYLHLFLVVFGVQQFRSASETRSHNSNHDKMTKVSRIYFIFARCLIFFCSLSLITDSVSAVSEAHQPMLFCLFECPFEIFFF